MSGPEVGAPPQGGRLHTVDPKSLNILIQEYDQALEENASKTETYEKFKEDYVSLRNRLITLPEQIEYDALIPLGTKALCPGKIIHTNEILCLLGDNWFIECTAKNASEIAANRLKKCEEMLAKLKKEADLYSSWKEEAQRQLVETLGEGTIEIFEDYDEENEKKWKAEHRENVRKYHQQLAKERKQGVEQSQSTKPEENDIWSRLDELEMEEELLEAGINLDSVQSLSLTNPTQESESIKSIDGNLSATSNVPVSQDNIVSPKHISKKVTFSSDNVVHTLQSRSEDTDDNLKTTNQKPAVVENPSNSSSETSTSLFYEPLVITFKHSSFSSIEDSIESNPEEENNISQVVVSPGDIIKKFRLKVYTSSTSAPKKSILKAKSSRSRDSGDPERLPSHEATVFGRGYHNVSRSTTISKRTGSATSARLTSIEEVDASVKDTVIEHRLTPPTQSETNPSPATRPDSKVDKKPVSFFKRSRDRK